MPLFTLAEIMVLTTCRDLFDAIKLVNDKICQCDFILDSDNIIVKKESRDLNKMIFFRCYLLIMPFPILQRRTAKIISELMRKIITVLKTSGKSNPLYGVSPIFQQLLCRFLQSEVYDVSDGRTPCRFCENTTEITGRHMERPGQ